MCNKDFNPKINDTKEITSPKAPQIKDPEKEKKDSETEIEAPKSTKNPLKAPTTIDKQDKSKIVY